VLLIAGRKNSVTTIPELEGSFGPPLENSSEKPENSQIEIG
jgi:hypothetical protein